MGVGFGIQDLSQGKPISAAFDFGSAIPGPIGWAFLAGGLGYNLLGSPGEGKPSGNKKQQPKMQAKVDKSKQLDASKSPEFGNVDIPADVSQQAQTTKMPSRTFNLGPAPEQQPNVVMMSSLGGGQPQQPQMTSSGGAASDVPAIASSNPSNFYTLYSQVNYNVVM